MPDAVERAARDGGLIVFVGAGISVAPPTCLPSWWDLNQAVVEALARQVAPTAGETLARDLARTVSERQREDRFPPEYQAEVIVGRLRQRYFEVLRCLDGDEPNASHLALAALAGAGHVRAILTTNFDRVLEAAFRRLHVPLEVSFEARHFEALAAQGARLERTGAPCLLLKIHGSADSPETLVDTLSQRKRGLPPATDACIRRLLRVGPWLFVGFSGADLAAEENYLHLRGDRDVARGFTWLVREGTQPLAAVRDLAELYGERARIVHGELPGWLEVLARRLTGTPIPAPDALSERAIAERRAAASHAVVEHTDAWAVSLGVRRCAVVLAALLEAVGDPAGALALLSRMRESASPDDRETGTYAMMCDQLGSLLGGRAEYDAALERFAEAATIFEALGAEQPAAGVRSNMGLALTDLGRWDEALAHFETARGAAAAHDDRADEAVAVHNIALVHRSRGDFLEAVRLFEEELEHVIALGDERGRATVLLSIGEVLARLDRHEDALDRLRASLAIVERLGDERGRANALGNMATVHHARAEHDEALRLYDEVGAIFARLGDVAGCIRTLLHVAGLEQARGRLDDALARAEQAAGEALAAGLSPLHARALHTVGALHRERGEADSAEECLRRALELRTAAGDRRGRADTLNELGILLRQRARPMKARDALVEALRIRTELGEERARAEVLNNLAMLAQDRGELNEAVRLLREALAIYDNLGLHAAAAPAAFNLGSTSLALHDLEGAAKWFEIALDLIVRVGHPARATDARLAIAWTRGLQGRVQDAAAAFAAAEARAATPHALIQVAARMRALAAVYRDNGHDDLADRLEAGANRAAARAGAEEEAGG